MSNLNVALAPAVSRRDLQRLATRLRKCDAAELRDVARILDCAIRGETITAPHVGPCTCDGVPCWRLHLALPRHVRVRDRRGPWIGAHAIEWRAPGACHAHGSEGLCWLACEACEHVPVDCSSCAPAVWLAWVLGVAFGTAVTEVPIAHGLPSDWFGEIARRGQVGDPPPAWHWYDESRVSREIKTGIPYEEIARRSDAASERAEKLVHAVRGTKPAPERSPRASRSSSSRTAQAAFQIQYLKGLSK